MSLSKLLSAAHPPSHWLNPTMVRWSSAANVFLFSVKKPATDVVFFLRTQCRAGTTCLQVLATPEVVVATAGKSPHIVQRPYDGFADFFQVFHFQKTISYPMQINNIRINLVDLPADIIRGDSAGKGSAIFVAIKACSAHHAIETGIYPGQHNVFLALWSPARQVHRLFWIIPAYAHLFLCVAAPETNERPPGQHPPALSRVLTINTFIGLWL